MIRTRMRLSVLVTLLTTFVALGQPASGAEPPKPATDLYGDALPPGAVARFGTLRWRHNITVNNIALDPSGSLIASVRNGGGVCVWDAKTGQETERFRGKPIRGEKAIFSPDGKTLLTGDREGRIQEWEVASAKLLHDGPGKYKDCPLFAVERDEHTVLVLTGSGKTVLVDDMTVDRLLQMRKQQKGYGIDLSPDGKLAAVAIDRGPVGLYNSRTGEVLRKLQGDKRGAFGVKFSPDSKLLVAWSGFGDIRVWDVSSGKELLHLAEDEQVYTFSPDGRILVISRDRGIGLVDVDTGKTVRTLEGRNAMVRDVAYSPDGRLLIAAGGDHTVRLWDSKTGKEVMSFAGQQFIVGGLAFSPDGKSLATCSEYGGLIVWDVKTSRPRHKWSDFLYGVSALAWSPDGTMLAAGESGGHDNREVVIRLLDPREGRLLREFPAHLNSVFSLSFSPDGKQLASVGWDARARIWDPATGKRLHQIRGGDNLGDAHFSRDGKKLLVDNGELEIYQTEGWRLLHRLELEKEEQRQVQRVGILPDGKTIVTREEWEEKGDDGRFNGTFRSALCYRSVENGHLLRSVQLPDSEPFWSGRCILSPNGDIYIETAQSRDAWGFRVRDAANGKVMGMRAGHSGFISAWAFSPDGRKFATGSSDTTVLLWDLTEMQIKFWWSELAAKPEDANRAVQRLAAFPADALPLVAAKVRTAAEQEGKAARLVAQLDADDFKTRENASKELADLKGAARLALELAQADKPSAEAKRRIEELLEKLPARGKNEEGTTGRQALQAVVVLEKIGNADARNELDELAKGPAESRLRLAAKAALRRLETSQSPDKERPR